MESALKPIINDLKQSKGILIKFILSNKYKKLDPIELFEAMERHLLAVKEYFQYNTSLIDDDGCNHIAKIATNADMLFVQLNLLANENK